MTGHRSGAAEQLAAELLAACRARRLTLATCESLTGGMLAAAITSIPGSSDVFRGGLVTYHSDLKIDLANVNPELVATHGVVNELVASQMAAGAAAACGADLALATTGVAGPGPNDSVPAGTVWLALQLPSPRAPRTSGLQLVGDRNQVRSQTVLQALAWAREVVFES